MATTDARPGWFRRFILRSAAWRPISAFYARTLHHIDRFVYRRSGGRSSFVSWLAGLPIVMLTTTGAKSGKPRLVPVVGIPDGDAVVVIASSFARAANPAWYHNLRADPRASISWEGRDLRWWRRSSRARSGSASMRAGSTSTPVGRNTRSAPRGRFESLPLRAKCGSLRRAEAARSTVLFPQVWRCRHWWWGSRAASAAERQFRRIIGYRDPARLAVAVEREVASAGIGPHSRRS